MSGVVDMRSGSPVRAGTFAYEGNELVTPWHAHDLHQIEYAFQGTVEVETEAGHYLLPPQQAAWIPAGLMHQTTIMSTVRTVSVFFHPDLVPEAGDSARILAAAPVIREMILYGVRWPIDRTSPDPMADGFFATLADLVGAGLDQETPLCLPTSPEPLIAAVMAYTDSHLEQVTEGPGVPIGRAVRTDAASSVHLGHRHDMAELRVAGAVPSSDGPAGRTGAQRARGGDGGRFRERECLLTRLRPPCGGEPHCLSTADYGQRQGDGRGAQKRLRRVASRGVGAALEHFNALSGDVVDAARRGALCSETGQMNEQGGGGVEPAAVSGGERRLVGRRIVTELSPNADRTVNDVPERPHLGLGGVAVEDHCLLERSSLDCRFAGQGHWTQEGPCSATGSPCGLRWSPCSSWSDGVAGMARDLVAEDSASPILYLNLYEIQVVVLYERESMGQDVRAGEPGRIVPPVSVNR